MTGRGGFQWGRLCCSQGEGGDVYWVHWGDFVVDREGEVVFNRGDCCSQGWGGVHGGDFVVHRDGEVVFTGGDSVVHRDGEVVFTATPGVLQLRGLRPDQSGTYSCTADNGIGPPAVGSVDVVLQCESAV